MRVFTALSRDEVLARLQRWAGELRCVHPEVERIGLFGSYARGDYAPGSDLDLLIILSESSEPRWFMRAAAFDTTALPAGADLFVYTEAEAARMRSDSPWFAHVEREVLWLE